MDWKLIFCMGLAAAGLLFGLSQWLRARRQLERMDRMLDRAIDGSFLESSFDESVPSALESKMSRFLNGSASSARNLAEEKSKIAALIADVSHQTKTPIANLLLYASLLAESELTPEQQAQIFSRFYRGAAVREQEGLGLGLYLTRRILTSEGGYIRVSSQPGKGSTFSLYLPLE